MNERPDVGLEEPTGVPTEPDRTSGYAIASLASGVLGLLFVLPVIGSVGGIVLGIVARRKIGSSAGRLGGLGLAHAGIALGGLGIFGALLLLLFAI